MTHSDRLILDLIALMKIPYADFVHDNFEQILNLPDEIHITQHNLLQTVRQLQKLKIVIKKDGYCALSKKGFVLWEREFAVNWAHFYDVQCEIINDDVQKIRVVFCDVGLCDVLHSLNLPNLHITPRQHYAVNNYKKLNAVYVAQVIVPNDFEFASDVFPKWKKPLARFQAA